MHVSRSPNLESDVRRQLGGAPEGRRTPIETDLFATEDRAVFCVLRFGV